MYLEDAVLKVVRYEPSPVDACICIDEKGNSHRIDLVVCGNLPGMVNSELVGKTVRIQYAHPFVSCAEGTEIIGENANNAA